MFTGSQAALIPTVGHMTSPKGRLALELLAVLDYMTFLQAHERDPVLCRIEGSLRESVSALLPSIGEPYEPPTDTSAGSPRHLRPC